MCGTIEAGNSHGYQSAWHNSWHAPMPIWVVCAPLVNHPSTSMRLEGISHLSATCGWHAPEIHNVEGASVGTVFKDQCMKLARPGMWLGSLLLLLLDFDGMHVPSLM